MKKLLLFIAILISTMGLFAQNVGDNAIINYDGYSLEFTVTSIEPAECKVYCSTHPTSLTEIVIPSSVTIEGMEFSVTSIGDNAFAYCSNLTSIDIPNSVTSIGHCAFILCSLTSIDIPSTITSIGDGAFSSCSNLTSIEIPNSVTSIGNSTFHACSELTSIDIPNSVTSIGENALDMCYSLTSIEFPNSLTSIGKEALSGNWRLTSIYCHAENVPETDNSAFGYCLSLEVIYVPANSVDAYQAASPWNNYTILPMDGEDDIVVNVGDSIVVDYEGYSLKFTVTSIEPAECEVVCSTQPTTPTEITIPSLVEISEKEVCVTSIGEFAFEYCENLTSIEIPNSVTSIGKAAFNRCSSLISLEIPEGVTYIGPHAIQACQNLKSVEIPSSVTEIVGNDEFAGCGYNFNNCPNLESIKVDSGNPVYDSRNNCNAIIETETNTLIAGCNNTILPNGVTIIGWAAFMGSNLEHIEVPNSVTIIEPFAFGYIDAIDLEEGTLKSITFEENSQLERIGHRAFIECYNLTSIEIPNSVTSIESDAFNSCYNLTSIEIPNSVTSIGKYAFAGCSNLTSIVIPNSDTSIGEGAFAGCSNLTSVYCYAENVIVSSDDIFHSCPSDMIIYVPAQSVDAYKAASPWNKYTILPMGEIVNHWTPDESLYANNMSVIGLIQIDGVNQNSTSLEIGAFCGEEVRGSQLVQYIPELDKYLVFLTIHGDNENDEISFRLYNHETEEELDLRSPEAVTFTVNGTLGSITSPYVLNFSNMVNVTASVNPENAGSVSGAGEYAINDIVTLTATSNEGYQFINWTEEGTIVSEETEYSFTVMESRELVANFELLTYNVTASANPAEGGSISGAGVYTHGETATLSATANEGYQFINWTEEGTIVSEESEYSFTVAEARELVANFELLTYNVTANANPAEGGSISGSGVYTHGETATLSATANTGYQFINWTEEGTIVSEEAEYSFTVTESRELVANFNCVQSRNLKSGWSWFSSYIEISGAEGLEMIEEALGENGLQIKNQTAFVSNSSSGWYGSLTSVSVESMYMIETSAAHELTLSGDKVNPENHPISIGTNWRWISYLVSENIDVEEALNTINPNHGDYIKSHTLFSQYYDGIGWVGGLNTMNPGEGYMYQNTSGMTKTLVYPSGASSKGRKANVTTEDNHWIADAGRYANNMSMIAFVKDNLETEYEIGAFVGEELRGSARPIYIEALDSYLIFMTIYGEANEEITFKYYDVNNAEEEIVFTKENVIFSTNAVLGSVDNPVAMMFDTEGLDENGMENVSIYPNPANVNSEINLGMTCDRVEIYNTIGVKIAEYSNVNKIDGMETAGVYMIRLTNGEEAINCRIVVE